MAKLKYPRFDDYEHPSTYEWRAYFSHLLLEAFTKQGRHLPRMTPELLDRIKGLIIYVDELEQDLEDRVSTCEAASRIFSDMRKYDTERMRLWLLWRAARGAVRWFKDIYTDNETGQLLKPCSVLGRIAWSRLMRRCEGLKMSKKTRNELERFLDNEGRNKDGKKNTRHS